MPQRILIVEDAADLREALAETLREEGYDVVTASQGLDALERLRGGERPDVILLDLMMPVMNDWEFRSHQKEDPTLASIPVIILSAVHDVESQIAELGALAAIRKPIPLPRLLESLRQVVS